MMKPPSPSPTLLLIAVFLSTGLTLSFIKSQDTSRRLVPRADADDNNVYQGRWYCIDGHAHWAHGLRDLMTTGGGQEARDALRSLRPADLPTDHATPFVLLGPSVIALISIVTGDVVSAYRLASLLAILATAFLVHRVLTALGRSRQCAQLAIALLLSQYWIMHAEVALYQDPWALMITALLMERSVAFIEHRGWSSLLLAAFVSSFVKITGTLAGVGLAAAILASAAAAGRIPWRRALTAAGATVLVPVAALVGFTLAVGGHDGAERYQSWLSIFARDPGVIIDIGLILQVNLLLMLIRRSWLKDAVLRACGLFGVLYAIALPLLFGGVSGRHLLPAVAPLVAVGATCLARLEGRLRTGLLLATFVANAGLLLATTVL